MSDVRIKSLNIREALGANQTASLSLELEAVSFSDAMRIASAIQNMLDHDAGGVSVAPDAAAVDEAVDTIQAQVETIVSDAHAELVASLEEPTDAELKQAADKYVDELDSDPKPKPKAKAKRKPRKAKASPTPAPEYAELEAAQDEAPSPVIPEIPALPEVAPVEAMKAEYEAVREDVAKDVAEVLAEEPAAGAQDAIVERLAAMPRLRPVLFEICNEEKPADVDALIERCHALRDNVPALGRIREADLGKRIRSTATILKVFPAS